MGEELVSQFISGLFGGIITGVAAIATMRTELRWMRADIDRHEEQLNQLHKRRATDNESG